MSVQQYNNILYSNVHVLAKQGPRSSDQPVTIVTNKTSVGKYLPGYHIDPLVKRDI